ncbi:MAG: hypothetical protein KF726_18850 [Anaerolineae bacterium]|nr:hypothetical protein [Anaerolineae bacterium]
MEAETTTTTIRSGREEHLRQRRNQIVAPLVIMAAVTLLGIIVMVIGFSSRQVAIVANCLSVIILLPAVLICFVPLVVMLGLTFATALGYGKVGSVLSSLRNAALRGHILTLRASKVIARPVIAFNQRFASMEAAVQRIRNKPSTTSATASTSVALVPLKEETHDAE